MSDTQPTDLPPETRAVLARARNALLISMGVLFAGFAVIGVLLAFRTMGSGGGSTGADYVIAALRIPGGAEVVSAVAADGKVTVTYRAGLMTSVRIFDGKSGALLREIPVVSE
jgi:hypothetical protein